MRTFKQSLCRTLLRRACVLAGSLLLAGVASVAWAQPARPSAAAATPAPAPVPLGPEQQLTQSVQQWVAQRHALRAEQVQLVPMDARLKVQGCARPLAIDQPFASPETVRVRCADPAWQLYMRVQAPSLNAVPSTGTAAPAPAAAAQEIRRPVVVAGHPLLRGMTVQSGDVRLQEVVLPPTSGTYIDQVADVLHSEVLRDIPAGTPLRRSDLRPLVLVKRGQLVQLSVGKSTGFMVSARVEALQDGRMGEQIKLKNNESGRVLSGVVRGPGIVEGP